MQSEKMIQVKKMQTEISPHFEDAKENKKEKKIFTVIY